MHNPSQIQVSIEEICKLEQVALSKRTSLEKIADVIATEVGKVWFILLHVIWFSFWIIYNEGEIPNLKAFDPFPFSLLTTIVSLEAIFLSLFILTSQNRAARQADQRSHLDLQINLLAERENTIIIEMLQAICADRGLGIADRPEITLFLRQTDLKGLSDEIARSIPSVGENTKTIIEP